MSLYLILALSRTLLWIYDILTYRFAFFICVMILYQPSFLFAVNHSVLSLAIQLFVRLFSSVIPVLKSSCLVLSRIPTLYLATVMI
jgi:hypothetical protein